MIVPTGRIDVAREVDLIEEVARHHGYDRVPARFPVLVAPPPPNDPRSAQARHLRGVMTGAGFFEAMTFGFIAEAAAAPFAPAGDIVGIANPLSETFAVLRPSLIPGLLDGIGHNRRREQPDVRLFEIGARFSRAAGERRAIAFAWTGAADPPHWSAPPAPRHVLRRQGRGRAHRPGPGCVHLGRAGHQRRLAGCRSVRGGCRQRGQGRRRRDV